MTVPFENSDMCNSRLLLRSTCILFSSEEILDSGRGAEEKESAFKKTNISTIYCGKPPFTKYCQLGLNLSQESMQWSVVVRAAEELDM